MVALLLAGRVVRRQLLEGPDGAWRDDLWLDALVDEDAAADGAGAGDPSAAAPGPAAAQPAGMNAEAPAATGPEPTAGSAAAGPRAASGHPAGRARKASLTAPLAINTCAPDSLLLLPGVGPVLAARLDEARRAGKVFRTPADLLGIKGIGPAAVSRLSPLIRFAEGVPPPAATPAGDPVRADNPH